MTRPLRERVAARLKRPLSRKVLLATATRVFLAGVIVSYLTTELLREVIHSRRKRRDGLGGTQDVAMWGTLAMLVCLLAAAITGFIGFVSR